METEREREREKTGVKLLETHIQIKKSFKE